MCFKTGFHNGIKKMHRQLQKDYFWRYSYKSVADFVQKCTRCTPPNEACVVTKPSKSLLPWNQIELHLIVSPEPVDSDQYLGVLYDPISNWVSASALPRDVLELVSFVLENFCNYGPARCSVYDLSREEFSQLAER